MGSIYFTRDKVADFPKSGFCNVQIVDRLLYSKLFTITCRLSESEEHVI